MKDDISKAYHEGYEQGRFDAIADIPHGLEKGYSVMAVVRGEWITTETYSSMYRTNLSETTCSACGKRPNIYMLKSDYCPNCGAKMDGES